LHDKSVKFVNIIDFLFCTEFPIAFSILHRISDSNSIDIIFPIKIKIKPIEKIIKKDKLY